eukprot:5122800-Amphidinium_carterae.1
MTENYSEAQPMMKVAELTDKLPQWDDAWQDSQQVPQAFRSSEGSIQWPTQYPSSAQAVAHSFDATEIRGQCKVD